MVGAAVWLLLRDFLQGVAHLGASWKLVLGIVFVLLVCFLRGGIIGGLRDLYGYIARKRTPVKARSQQGMSSASQAESGKTAQVVPITSSMLLARRSTEAARAGPILEARGLTKHYGGVIANEGIDFSVARGELRGIIGPNEAGKTTFFRMLTCEVPPTSGTIRFEGRDITGMGITDVCQLGLTKSYQVNQLFNRLTVGENVTIAALAALRGKFRLDALRSLAKIRGLSD